MTARDQGVYVGVGSNIDPLTHIPRALELLAEQLTITAISGFYQSPAAERPEQDDYRNGVVRIESPLSPNALKYDVLRVVEERMGRRRSADKFAPRVIDLDLLLYDDIVLDEKTIKLPDPDIRRRAYISVPLHELAPNLILPGTLEPLREVPSVNDTAQLKLDMPLTTLLNERFIHEPRTC